MIRREERSRRVQTCVSRPTPQEDVRKTAVSQCIEHSPDWILIPQMEHARVAADLAAAWGNGTETQLPYGGVLLEAIRRHDDGWRDWEAAPELHPETGFPRDFLEMPMEDATRMWSDGIQVCADMAPVAGVWVSRHFCWLGRRALETRQDNLGDLEATRRFLAEQQTQQQQWTADCRRQYGNDTEKRFRTGCALIQFFDRISLWLGCAPETEPVEVELYQRGTFRLTPRTPALITIAPYPLSVERLELSVPVRRVAARRYASDGEFRSVLASAEREFLRWTITAENASDAQ